MAPDTGRLFVYRELVLSGFYSPEGLAGVPPQDMTPDHVELSPRPPGSYIALDIVKTFTSLSPANRLFPDAFPLTAMELHPRLVFERSAREDGLGALRFAPQDFWVRFSPRDRDRLTIRAGQFVLPYGVNPIQAPRQRFLLPLESLDLGLKWDWGIDVKGPFRRNEWEVAATLGLGEALHSPRLFSNAGARSYLLTGRVGTPTYMDFQYGFSFLRGQMPTLRGAIVVDDEPLSRWRSSFDTFYRFGTYLMAGGQISLGQDGFSGDGEKIALSRGRTADVVGYRIWADFVLPRYQNVRLGAQFESVIRDLSTPRTDDTALILEFNYSSSTEVTWRVDYRQETDRSNGTDRDALFFSFIYYGS
ncbi:MAG: hypothetical protein ACE5ID_08035 [Acidobacteriota bacterium]